MANKLKVKKGDEVIVLAGKDKGKKGKIICEDDYGEYWIKVDNMDITFKGGKQTGNFVFEDEINKYDQFFTTLEKQNEIKKIITHELGHYLGLDHNFEDSTSIMSYDDVNKLGPYDISAILELYKDQVSINSETK